MARNQMQQAVNSMMDEQLYKDGYVLCFSGMKTRRSAFDAGESCHDYNPDHFQHRWVCIPNHETQLPKP